MGIKFWIFSPNNPLKKEILTGGDIRLLELAKYAKVYSPKTLFSTQSITQKIFTLIIQNFLNFFRSLKFYRKSLLVFDIETMPFVLLSVSPKVLLIRKNSHSFDEISGQKRSVNWKRLFALYAKIFYKKLIFQTKYDLDRFPFSTLFKKKSIVLHNNVNTERVMRYKYLLDTPLNCNFISFIGDPSVKRKNFDFFLKLSSDFPDQSFKVIGASGSGRINLKFTGFMSETYFSEFINSKLVVIPSLDEGMSNVMTEAIYFKVPILLSSIEVHKEIVNKFVSENLRYSIVFENYSDLVSKVELFLNKNDDSFRKNNFGALMELRESLCFDWVQEVIKLSE